MSWLSAYVQLFALLTPVIACTSIGAVWAAKKIDYPGRFVSVLVTSVSTPCLVFSTLVSTRLDNTLLLQVSGTALAALLTMGLVAALLLRMCKLSLRGFLPAAIFPNAGNLGLPLSQLTFGDDGLAVAVTIFAVFSLLQHTIGVAYLGWVNPKKEGAVRTFPYGATLVAVLAVFIRVFDMQVPMSILKSTQLVGSLSIPLMLISLGHALMTVSHRGVKQGAWLAGVRLCAGLLAGAALVSVFQLPPMVNSVLVLMLGMPVAVVSFMYADRLTHNGETVAGAVLVSTLVFVVLSPLLMSWAGWMGSGLIH
jgi:predicted permease